VCGIAGFAGAGTRDDLRAMGDAIRHRGPDGEGIHVDERHHVHLVHRRLAILDIAGGDQPMWNEDRTVCVIFNGEIYNHLELRAMLAARGHSFRSDHSDTEVLVHGYEEWGEELPARLNGMFAFAVWDSVRARLFLARDRFGKKPLYYCSEPGFFAFASELTALQRHPSVPCDVDRRSLQKLLAYGFVPAPRSLYRAIERLPGGCQVMVDVARPHAATARRYWQFAIDAPASIPRNPERAWGEELRALLSQAVRRRLMSDVPLGVFLSGGIDSSAVLAYACANLPKGQVHSYSIGFHEASFDESAHARQVAAKLGATHHEEILDIERARALAPEVLGRLDEPFADPSIVPTFLLCRFARQEITVALGGDGGDELFAGYDPFRALKVARWYNALVPSWMKGGIRRLADWLPVSDENMSLDFRIRRGPAGRFTRGADVEPGVAGTDGTARGGRTAGRARGRRGPVLGGDRGLAKRARHASGRSHARVLHALLPAGRHPRQGRPCVNDGFARSALAFPRPGRRRFRAPHPARIQVPSWADQVPAEGRAARRAARRDHRPQEEGLRHSRGEVAARVERGRLRARRGRGAQSRVGRGVPCRAQGGTA
jgi:asparagine synthase (glutamine-hydrolysing)